MNDALELVSELVQQQNAGDANYFRSQKSRFQYSVERILKLFPPPRRVLDIGSHYLHQSMLLSILGYEVYGLDVPVFTDPAFIRERAEAADIKNHCTTSHETGGFMDGCEESFDVVVCTEVLEHITFNPVSFWRRIWELATDRSVIYLTTPNSFRLRALVKAVLRLLTLEGLGIPVKDVLGVVTFGHHWKEYSCREIKEYFHRLSPDFSIKMRTYADPDSNGTTLAKALEILPWFRSNIEAIISLTGKTDFAAAPSLPFLGRREMEPA